MAVYDLTADTDGIGRTTSGPCNSTIAWACGFWIYSASAPTPANASVLYVDDGTSSVQIYFTSGGNIGVKEDGFAGSAGTYGQHGSWAYVSMNAVQFNANLNVNGSAVITTGFYGTINSSLPQFSVGKSDHDPYTYPTHGFRIAYLKVWDTNVSLATIDAERYSPRAIYRTNLWGEFPLIGSGPNLRANQAGNGYDLSETGTPSVVDDHPGIQHHASIILPQEAAAAGFTGTSAITIPALTITATGVYELIGTSAISIPVPSISGSGTLDFIGTSAIDIPVPAISASGILGFEGTGDVNIPVPAVSASGSLDFIGTSAVDIPVPAISASGTMTPAGFTGTSAINIPVPAVSASGVLEFTGSSAIDIPVPAISASGTMTAGFTGTSAISIPILSVSASGSLDFIGTAALSIPVPTMDASGFMGSGYFGTAAISIPLPVLRTFGIMTDNSALYDGAVANTVLSDLHLRIQLIEAKTGNLSNENVLLSREIRSIQINEPILFGYPSKSVSRYMAPIKVKVEVLSGDATVLKNAIMTIRYRRGS